MANAICLKSGLLRDLQPLGADGNPVYQSAPQLRAAIKRTLGEDVADIFAIPQRSEDGNRIDWYTSLGGAVVSWSSATHEEQLLAKQQLLNVCKKIQETSRLMQAENDSERQVFGRLLKYVTRIPGDDYIHLVDGRPVLTFWGFHEHGAPADHDALRLLSVNEADEAATDRYSTATTPLNTVTTALDSESRKRYGRWWLLLPLILLLLMLLGFLLMRGCAPGAGSGLGLPDLSMRDLGSSDQGLTTEQESAEEGMDGDVGDTNGSDTATPELQAVGMQTDEPALEKSRSDEPVGDGQSVEEQRVESQSIDEQSNDENAGKQPRDDRAVDDRAADVSSRR